MAVNVLYNGVTYPIPVAGDRNWAPPLTRYLVALASGSLQLTGGSFPLLADVNFGPTFGLLTKYVTSVTANPATAGFLRLTKTDTIDWRNNANTANLPLAINGSDVLTFNGVPLAMSSGGTINAGIQYQLGYYASNGTVISGLTLITPNKALQSDANGLPIASGVSSTTLSYLDATSSIQTQINSTVSVANAALPKTGGTMSGVINMGSNKITNLPNGTSSNDAINFSQLPAQTGTITNWVAYTPAVGGFAAGAVTSAFWRRVGDTLEVKLYVTTTAVDTIILSIAIPSSLNIDTTKTGTRTNSMVLGFGSIMTNTTITTGYVFFDGSDTVNVYFTNSQDSSLDFLKRSADAMATGAATITVNFSTPITGWSI